MICSEGYKAFRGTMRIVPKNPNMKPYELTADWLYKPEYQCWYGKGSSFPEEICEVVVDLTATLPNNQLTFDQLREMDGEPVWIKSDNWHCKGKWGLVSVWTGPTGDKFAVYVFDTKTGATLYPNQEYGRCWQAYRRKLEEGNV